MVNIGLEDDFDALRVLKQHGSRDWLSQRPEFTFWQTSKHVSLTIFGITAMPGSGKSILSSHVRDALNELGLISRSDFSSQGNKSRASVFSECLRSLAYQMAQADPELSGKAHPT